MITRAYSFDELKLSDSYYGGKIRSYAEAYGFGYDFCRFYRADGGSILINNSNGVFDGDFLPDEELDCFIRFSGITSFEAEFDIDIEDFDRMERYFLTAPAAESFSYNEKDLSVNCRLGEVYEILEKSFGKMERDIWYADMSHRIRHGVSRLFLYKNSAVGSVDFEYGDMGYISDIAVSPEARGQGLAGELLGIIHAYLFTRNITGGLYAYNDMLPFYLHNGYKVTGSGSYYTLKGI
ncbi:MAG: GNAT family N-acetyltransferase [Oscillospiraceae bacterium]